MAIWIFGDSFSKHFDYLPDSWVELTSTKLGEPVHSFSNALTTLEYSFHQFNQQRNNIKEKDIVIASITTLPRRWFWKDRPFRILDLNEEDQNALNYYDKFLLNIDENHKIYLINFLYNLHYLTKKLNLHTIVLFNFYDFDKTIQPFMNEFPLFHIARGRVGIASDYEYKPEILKNINTEWFMKYDKRINHFIRSNHLRISEKFIENIKHQTPINFFEGLITGLLDDELLLDPKFTEYELFTKEMQENKPKLL